MPLRKYKAFVEKYIDLTQKEWEELISKRKTKEFKKGEIILYQGEICKELYFINYGLARAFTLDTKGKDFTWNIFFNDPNATVSNLFVTDYKSFLRQEKASLQIEVLEDMEVTALHFDDLNTSRKKSMKGMEFGMIMAHEAYCFLHELALQRQTKSAQERFDELIEKTPFLLEKVPQYHIASLLGITPQHLSRLKKKL